MTFADQLRKARKNKGITQIQLAKALGVSNGTVAMWETGKRFPDEQMLMRIGKGLGTPIVFGDLSKGDVRNTDEMTLLTSYRDLDARGRGIVLHTIAAEQRRINAELQQYRL